jgi:hypothetical protein
MQLQCDHDSPWYKLIPEISDGDKVEPGCNFSHRERRILLQKVFVQVTSFVSAPCQRSCDFFKACPPDDNRLRAVSNIHPLLASSDELISRNLIIAQLAASVN